MENAFTSQVNATLKQFRGSFRSSVF